jgi:riboflavin transporter FmnP
VIFMEIPATLPVATEPVVSEVKEAAPTLWSQIQDNMSFVLVCIGIVALLAVVAWLTERYLLKARKVSPARRVAVIGRCAAGATVLHILDFPLPFLAPGFYKLDFSEVPVMLCGFYLGPSAVVSCEGIKILLKLLLKGTETAFVGDFANFVTGCSLVLPAVLVYHISKSKKSAVWGLVTGTLFLTAFGSAFNGIYLIPAFSTLYGMPLEVIVGMGTTINHHISSLTSFVIFAVAPLNLIKGILVSGVTLLLYKRVTKTLFARMTR